MKVSCKTLESFKKLAGEMIYADVAWKQKSEKEIRCIVIIQSIEALTSNVPILNEYNETIADYAEGSELKPESILEAGEKRLQEIIKKDFSEKDVVRGIVYE